MTALPEWCSHAFFQRFIGGQVAVLNKNDASFVGDITTIILRGGVLRVEFAWLAIALDPGTGEFIRLHAKWSRTDPAPFEVRLLSLPPDEDQVVPLYKRQSLDFRGLALIDSSGAKALMLFTPDSYEKIGLDRVESTDIVDTPPEPLV